MRIIKNYITSNHIIEFPFQQLSLLVHPRKNIYSKQDLRNQVHIIFIDKLTCDDMYILQN